MKYITLFLVCFLMSCNTAGKVICDLVLSNWNIIVLETSNVAQQHIFILNGKIQMIEEP